MQLHTSKVVAEYLDVTERRVRQLRDEGIITEVRPGMYNLKDTTRKYIRSIRQGDTGELNYTEEKAKLTKAKREREELELQVRQETLHDEADVTHMVSKLFVAFRSRLLAIPSKLAPAFVKETDRTKIEKKLKDQIYESLEELSTGRGLFEEMKKQEEQENGAKDG